MTTKPRRISLVVAFDMPEGTGPQDAKQYVLDAVASWGTGLRPPGYEDMDDPGHPYFGAPDSITVSLHDKQERKWPTRENST